MTSVTMNVEVEIELSDVIDECLCEEVIEAADTFFGTEEVIKEAISGTDIDTTMTYVLLEFGAERMIAWLLANYRKEMRDAITGNLQEQMIQLVGQYGPATLLREIAKCLDWEVAIKSHSLGDAMNFVTSDADIAKFAAEVEAELED